MKIAFLGTNGWYNTKTGNTICTLVETKEDYLIFDAGTGFQNIDKYITTEKPIYLFLSHFHLDHIFGLHILTKFKFKQGLHIYGQEGTKEILNKFINQPYTKPIDKLPYKVDIHELSCGTHKIPFPIECKYLIHSSRCMGYRINLDGKAIAYCTDTGICDNAIELAKNVDLLIAECSFKKEGNSDWPHLMPETAAELAKDAEAKKLALIHFDANIYKTLEERKEAEEKARQIFKNTIATMDNMQIEI